ncbi:hypothetical protein Tco_1026480 [Tanacetum coccineum]
MPSDIQTFRCMLRFEGVTDWYQSLVIMSFATSAITYTSVYTNSEPSRAFWGADDEEVSERGIPWVIVLGYDGLPIQPVAPPSPDYIPGPEDPQTPLVPQDEDEREPMFVQAHDPDYVPEPIYPEYIPLEDDHEFLAEGQPLPPIDSPTAKSPGYVTELDPEEDPEEDDANDEDEDDEDEEEEEEEHIAPADSTIVAPVDEPDYRRPKTIHYPFQERQRIASTQALIDVVTGALPPPPLPPLPPYLSIPPPVGHRDDIPESEQPPRKRLYLSTIGSKYEIGESSTARPTRGQGIDYGFVGTIDAEERRQGIRDVRYGIRDTWVDPVEAVLEIAPMTVGEVNTRVTELAELHERDIQDLYDLLEDAQDSRSCMS